MQLIATEYPYMPQSPATDNATILAVLVKDGGGFYRAYIGLVRNPDGLSDDERLEDANWVANHGRKLTYAKAVPEYFVGFKAEEYAE